MSCTKCLYVVNNWQAIAARVLEDLVMLYGIQKPDSWILHTQKNDLFDRQPTNKYLFGLNKY